MRILLVHNRYQQPGGEDVVFEQEKALLQDAGHDVQTYCRTNGEIANLSSLDRLILPAQIIWATETRLEFDQLLSSFDPDLVHAHNTFMMISPSIYSACKGKGVPVVQTLHNFRLLCPAAGFFRNGNVCEECTSHGLWRSVLHGCYRESRAETTGVAAMLAVHRMFGTWNRCVDRYITLTEFAKQKFVSAGFPADKLTVKPNFIQADPGVSTTKGEYAVFAGRLSNEKGASLLLEAWGGLNAPCQLHLLGDGPAMSSLKHLAEARNLSVVFRGWVPHDDVLDSLKFARFLVIPSRLYETFGMCIIEAFACGVPVVCSRLGGMQEIVDHGRTGLHFTSGDPDDLAATVNWALEHQAEMAAMGRAARREYETRYTAKINYSQLMTIYEEAIASRGISSQKSKTQ